MADFKENLTATYKNADRGQIVTIAAQKVAYIYPNVWKEADGSHDESNLGTRSGPLTLGTATGNTYRDEVNLTDYLEVLSLGTYATASSVAVGVLATNVTIIYVQPSQVVLADNPDYDPTKDSGNSKYVKPSVAKQVAQVFKRQSDDVAAKEGEGLPIANEDFNAIRVQLEKLLIQVGKTGNPDATETKPSTGLTIALWAVMALAVVGIGLIIYRAVRKPIGA